MCSASSTYTTECLLGFCPLLGALPFLLCLCPMGKNQIVWWYRSRVKSRWPTILFPCGSYNLRNSLKTKMNWNAIYEYLDKRCYNVKLIYTYLDNLTCFNVKQWILLFFLIGSVLCNRNPFTPICVCACGGGDGGFNSCIALPHPQLFINCVFISGPSLRFSQYGNLCPW